MLKAMLLAAALIPSAAFAQTTTCEPAIRGDPNSGITCRGDEPQPMLRPEDVPARRCSRLEWMAWETNHCQVRGVAADHKAVTDLIADGHCDEAVKAALHLGDLRFAGQVRDYCAKQ